MQPRVNLNHLNKIYINVNSKHIDEFMSKQFLLSPAIVLFNICVCMYIYLYIHFHFELLLYKYPEFCINSLANVNIFIIYVYS